MKIMSDGTFKNEADALVLENETPQRVPPAFRYFASDLSEGEEVVLVKREDDIPRDENETPKVLCVNLLTLISSCAHCDPMSFR